MTNSEKTFYASQKDTTIQQQTQRCFNAICHPVRNFIIEQLRQNPSGFCVNEITQRCQSIKPIKQGAVSNHLKRLFEVDLVDFYLIGQHHNYYLDFYLMQLIDEMASNLNSIKN